jgi:hypothetical protein
VRTRTATWLAWGLAAFAVAATLGVLVVLLLGPFGLPFNDPDDSAAIDYLELMLFPLVGAFIASRRPANPVGWMLLAYSVAQPVGDLLAEYARLSMFADNSLPGGGLALWVTTWFWVVSMSLIPLIFLHFPNGRLPSPGWRWARWGCALPGALLLPPSLAVLDAPPRRLLAFYRSGEAIPGLEWTSVALSSVLVALAAVATVSVVSLFFRYKRAERVERQQLKWVMLAAALLTAGLLWSEFLPGPEPLKAALGALAFMGIPVSMAVAILRYRLYDVDRIINRTLVYAVVSALLALIYIAGVVGIGGVVRSATGQERDNLVVAASTLAVAGLFRPARNRIQRLIDRRFYRRKYDAVVTLEAFSARLRDQIDLESLSRELAAVTQQTMQPAHVSLWLRDREERRQLPA